MVKYYPKPKHDLIIEPFAGAAKYALRYFDRDIILYDKYERVIRLWHFLQQASKQDILGLPILRIGEDLRAFQLSDEELNFMRFHIGIGLAEPIWRCPSMSTMDRQKQALVSISNNLFKIRHFKVIHTDYRLVENQPATWFIDPPYQFGGHKYFESNKSIDYSHLAEWCQGRVGQVLVCENAKAKWMDFQLLRKHRGLFKQGVECIWTNQLISVFGQQLNFI